MSKLLKKVKKNVSVLAPWLKTAAKYVQIGAPQSLNNHYWFSYISFWTCPAQPRSVGRVKNTVSHINTVT